MAQTKAGALLVKARTAGISVDEYVRRVNSGLKRCTRCKEWKPTTEFGTDRSRLDGKDATCFDCRRVKDPKPAPAPSFKGRTHSDETKQKMSQAKKGKPSKRLGLKHTDETRKKISEIVRVRQPRGENAYNFTHGRSQRIMNDRRRIEYHDWRMAVFTRDKYTCQKCGDSSGGNLRAHHIKPYAQYPELRLDVSNGITLCNTCHDLEHYKPDSTRNVRKLKRGEKLWEKSRP